jgi:hypothetical protein
MNLKCKIISNIKIFNFFIIHVAIDFSDNLIKIVDEGAFIVKGAKIVVKCNVMQLSNVM